MRVLALVASLGFGLLVGSRAYADPPSPLARKGVEVSSNLILIDAQPDQAMESAWKPHSRKSGNAWQQDVLMTPKIARN